MLARGVTIPEVRKVGSKRSRRLVVMVEHSYIFSLRVDNNFAEKIHVGEPNRRSKVAENVPEGLYR